jgi:predicted dehydrogenase
MTLRFALLGTGYWAGQVHAAAIAAHPRARLAAVWGRDPDKARKLGDRHGVPGFGDLDAALDGVDAVAVALPPDVQAPLAVRAATEGKHLLLDKPLALDPASADAVLIAAEHANVASVVFFTRRFVPPLQQILDDLVERGDCYAARVARLSDNFVPDSPYRESGWRRRYGGLWDVGPHALSLLVPVLGPVETVTAVPGQYQTTYVIFGHSGGATSTAELSIASPVDRDEYVFTRPHRETTMPYVAFDPVDALSEAIDQLDAQVRQGRRDHPCGVRFARDVVMVLAAAQRSQDEGVRVAVQY